ncbi:hypothetical protein [Aeoliella sp.]|uniref:hypothetical protein n=1 Tax=Aeoliella sp. TaxID=2795800 RepID=UPI003CCBCC1B
MAAISWLGYARLAYFSKPKHERQLYRAVRQQKMHRIVEVGIGSAERAIDLVSTAQRYGGESPVTYTGLDWFEEREAPAAPLPLIHAHRQLQLTGARVRLVPGYPPATLPQIANTLQRTDLILISAAVDDASLDKAWFYFPRMCHPGTLVLREIHESPEVTRLEPIAVAELERRAAQREVRKAA